MKLVAALFLLSVTAFADAPCLDGQGPLQEGQARCYALTPAYEHCVALGLGAVCPESYSIDIVVEQSHCTLLHDNKLLVEGDANSCLAVIAFVSQIYGGEEVDRVGRWRSEYARFADAVKKRKGNE